MSGDIQISPHVGELFVKYGVRRQYRSGEVLLEKGASVLGDLFRFKRQHGITDQADPISVLYGLVWSAKQEILISETETELEQIEGQFNLANRFISKMAGGLNE